MERSLSTVRLRVQVIQVQEKRKEVPKCKLKTSLKQKGISANKNDTW